jgi:hypothetical protein
MGDIELHITGGHTLTLTDVLYIPESSVQLISILTLNQSGNYTTHFDLNGCWVSNKSNTTLVCGALSNSKCLYVLTTKTLPAQHSKAPISTTPNTALLAKVPDIKTWHHSLGHCNTCTIVKMAKNGVSQGMLIDLSSLPPKCDHCALRKQTHSLVPKICEGIKVSRHLERVYVDLCRPMAITSQTGNLYCMNLINDFSGMSGLFPSIQKAMLAWLSKLGTKLSLSNLATLSISSLLIMANLFLNPHKPGAKLTVLTISVLPPIHL